jgi:hypothetical protein
MSRARFADPAAIFRVVNGVLPGCSSPLHARALRRCRLISRSRLRAVSPLPSDSWSLQIVACAKRVVPVTAHRECCGKPLLPRVTPGRHIELGRARERPRPRAIAGPGSATSARRARVPVRGSCRSKSHEGRKAAALKAQLGDIPPVDRFFRLEPGIYRPDPMAETGRRFVVRRVPVVSSPPTIVRSWSFPPHSPWPGSKQC